MIHEAKNKHGGLIVVAIGCEMNNNKNVRSTICLKCGKLIKQKTFNLFINIEAYSRFYD